MIRIVSALNKKALIINQTAKHTLLKMTKASSIRSNQLKNRKPDNQKLKSSSKEWIIRHINDRYVHEAKVRNYRSRAAFKLIEIDEKFKILKRYSCVSQEHTRTIIDLGAAPGGWSQIIAERSKKTQIIALDLLDIKPIESVEIIKGDFCDKEIQAKIKEIATRGCMSQEAPEAQQGKFIDLVLSDIAPSVTGIKSTDIARMNHIAVSIFEFCCSNMQKNGSVVFKYFQSGNNEIVNLFKTRFQYVRMFKPEASRTESAEIYIIAERMR